MADSNEGSGVRFRTLKMTTRPLVAFNPTTLVFTDAGGRDITKLMIDLSQLWKHQRAAFEAMMATADDVRLKAS